ncbi:hypothetical protein [Agrobacterium tumefaciens]|uniref:hypothetical protein n=1 Tax=Agrobacterium tumefaciens TaxID=358 RepID=UPI0021D36F52|nr:hypothetical protein [Agrobacterium tumefaciens]UXT99449.1 hypothetical protein FY129_18360 [Agrobacterium tumefaciens]
MAAETKQTGVRAKLKANKDAKSGTYDFPMKDCGVTATIPNFINHGLWMKAQRIAGNDIPKAQVAYVCETALFDGEKLTVTDIQELVETGDVLTLIAEVFGGKDDKGKEQTAA